MSYILKEQLAHPGNYGGTRTAGQIKYLVIHYTGNDGDKSANNAAYYQQNVVEASAHYFVDDTTVYRSVPELTVAWAVGGSKWTDCARTGGGTMYGVINNTNSISIELCDTVRDGSFGATEATMANAAELARSLMEKYNIPIENVYRHFDVTGKHCPAYMMDDAMWQAFKARLAGRKLDNTPRISQEAVDWARESGILKGNNGDLMLSSPCTREHVIVFLWRYHQRFGGGGVHS